MAVDLELATRVEGEDGSYRAVLSGYLAPNLDTSVWLHRFNPRCEWLLVDHQCSVAEHGLMGVSGSVWDTGGRLLASGSAQLCCVAGAP